MPEDRKRKVLIIDDECPIGEMISDFCQSIGFETKFLDSGEDAVRVVKDYRPDLITLDLLMPEVSGIEVLAELEGDEATMGIPVIIISSIAGHASVEMLLKKKTKEILAKPVNLGRLKSSIEKALSK